MKFKTSNYLFNYRQLHPPKWYWLDQMEFWHSSYSQSGVCFCAIHVYFFSFFLQWQTHQCCLSASSFNVKCCTFTSVLCCCISDMSSSLELSFIPNCPLNCRLVQVTVESIWLCDLWGQLAALWVWNNRISCNGRTDRMTERERGRGKEKTVPSSCQITL